MNMHVSRPSPIDPESNKIPSPSVPHVRLHSNDHGASQFHFFSRESMMALADQLSPVFKQAQPFPHVIIDNFFPPAVAEMIGCSFPGINDIDWKFEGPGDSKHSGNRNIEKVATNDEEKFPDFIRFMMMQFQSGIFCSFLDRLTGYRHLAPDPSHHGCGLHSTGNGGRLMLHLDASRHPNKDLNQIVNVIYYCSPKWEAAWGGGLELWTSEQVKAYRKTQSGAPSQIVEPLFNRMVIFYTAGDSWHGHPRPVVCPDGYRRNSLALYYYTTDSGLTGFSNRNYVEWASVTEHDQQNTRHQVKAAVRRTLPPAAVNSVAKVVRRLGLNKK